MLSVPLVLILTTVAQPVPRAVPLEQALVPMPTDLWLGIRCVADWHEFETPNHLRARGNVSCMVFDYAVSGNELQILRGIDSSPRAIDAPFVVRAAGHARASWLDNRVASDRLHLEFSGPGALSKVLLEFTGNELLLERPARRVRDSVPLACLRQRSFLAELEVTRGDPW